MEVPSSTRRDEKVFVPVRQRERIWLFGVKSFSRTIYAYGLVFYPVIRTI